MHSYKSLFVVAGLGGLLLFMAGVLLKTSDMTAAPRGQGKRSHAFTRIDPGGSLSRQQPDEGLFADDLKVIRETLERGRNSFVQNNPALKRALMHGQAVVSPGDFPLLALEMKRKDMPPAYRSILIILMGASRADEAIPILEGQYAEHPMRVLEALKLSGTTAACDAWRRLYHQAGSSAERYCLLQALRRLPPDFATEFLVDRLDNEMDRKSLHDVVNITRHVQNETMARALDAFLRRDDDRSREHFKVGCNALGAQRTFGGAELLFDLHLDGNLSDELRQASGVAIRFLKAPQAVDALLERLESAATPTEAVQHFLFRNATEGHRGMLESFIRDHPDSPWLRALQPALERLGS